MNLATSSLRSIGFPVLPVLIAGTAISLCYAVVCTELVTTWSTDPLYSYGFAVPLISSYILATRWRKFSLSVGAPDYVWGSLAVVVAALLFVIGEIGTALRLQELSLVLALCGTLLLIVGRYAFRRIWFAAAYLLLMVPVWTDLIGRLQVPSQLVSGRIAVEVFHLLGMPAVREGTLIYLPGITLEILRECSGVNQLVAIFAVTLPAAYLWLHGVFHRVLFVTVSLLIAYLSNGARIASIGVLAHSGFDTTAPGIHLAEGLLVASAGYGLIAVVFSLMTKVKSGNPTSDSGFADAAFVVEVPPARRKAGADLALVVVMLCSSAIGFLMPRTAVALKAGLGTLPKDIGAWKREGEWKPAEGGSIAADEEARFIYRRTSGERVRLYIGYLRYQQVNRGLANALPKLPYGRQSIWNVDLDSVKQLTLVEQASAGATRGAAFWYEVDGVAAADRLEAKQHVLWNALTRGRTNGAVIMVAWDVPSGADARISRERVFDFLRSLVPVLPNYLPSRA